MAASPPTGSKAAPASAPRPRAKARARPRPRPEAPTETGLSRRRFADRLEIALEHRIHDRRAAALLFELGKPTRDRRAALGDGRQGDETDSGFGLALQARARDWNRASGSRDGP